MSTYHSIQTGHAPGGFNLDHPGRFIDVAHDRTNPHDIRVIIDIDTPQHLITELIQLQQDAGATKETHW